MLGRPRRLCRSCRAVSDSRQGRREAACACSARRRGWQGQAADSFVAATMTLSRELGQSETTLRRRSGAMYTGSTDLTNAGAEWVDEEVAVSVEDGQTLVTSRKPDDLDAFCRELVGVLAVRTR